MFLLIFIGIDFKSSDNETIKTLNRIQRKPRGLKEVWLANRVTVWSSIKRRIRDSYSSPVKMNSLRIKLCLSSFYFSFFLFLYDKIFLIHRTYTYIKSIEIYLIDLVPFFNF